MTESPRVSEFILARQQDVLCRAIVAVADASPGDLPGEAHRLAGTLGTFGMPDAASLLRELEAQVKDPSCTPDAAAGLRIAVLARLQRMADDLKGA